MTLGSEDDVQIIDSHAGAVGEADVILIEHRLPRIPRPPRSGYAIGAVRLMLVHLREDTYHRVATLLIHPDNAPSLTVAERNGFERAADVDGRTSWRRPAAADH